MRGLKGRCLRLAVVAVVVAVTARAVTVAAVGSWQQVVLHQSTLSVAAARAALESRRRHRSRSNTA